MRIIFIRHGDPDYVNDSLTERGKKEAKLLGPYLASHYSVDYVYGSPMGRARLTAEPYLQLTGKKIEIREFLHEFKGGFIHEEFQNPDGSYGARGCAWDVLPRLLDDTLFDPLHWQEYRLFKDTDIQKEWAFVEKEFLTLLEEHGYKKEGRHFKVVRANHDTLLFFCHFGISSYLLSILCNSSPYVFLEHCFLPPTGIVVLNTEEREKGYANFRMECYGALPHLEEGSTSGRFKECGDDAPLHKRDK